MKHLNDFINNMRPSQRSTGTTTSQEYFVCLTEAEHPFFNSVRHWGNDRLTTNGNIRSRGFATMPSVPSTTSCTSRPQRHQSQQPSCTTFPTARVLYLYSFILMPSSSSAWSRYNRRAGYIELEPSNNQFQVAPTPSWGILNSIIMESPATILSFVGNPSRTSTHIVDFNLISHPKHIHIPSVISMIQHAAIRQRIKHFLHQQVFHESFLPSGHLQPKWTTETSASIVGTSSAATTDKDQQKDTTAAAAAAASASATASPSTSSWWGSQPSVVINNPPSGSSFVIKFRSTTTSRTSTWATTTTTAEQLQQQQQDVWPKECKPHRQHNDEE